MRKKPCIHFSAQAEDDRQSIMITLDEIEFGRSKMWHDDLVVMLHDLPGSLQRCAETFWMQQPRNHVVVHGHFRVGVTITQADHIMVTDISASPHYLLHYRGA